MKDKNNLQLNSAVFVDFFIDYKNCSKLTD